MKGWEKVELTRDREKEVVVVDKIWTLSLGQQTTLKFKAKSKEVAEKWCEAIWRVITD